MARINKRRISRTIATAKRNFGISISEDQAKRIIRWDDEQMFVVELKDSGILDTTPLDYFRMAIVDLVMPGAPTVQDDLIKQNLSRWHFPMNGSSKAYKKAFLKEWGKSIKKIAVKN